MIKNKNWNTTIVLACFFLIYKVSLEFGYWFVLRGYFFASNEYDFEFRVQKYIVGFIMAILVFLAIDHESRKVSTFFFEMHYVLAIIPITVIYAFGNKQTVYYMGVCIAFILAILIVRLTRDINYDPPYIITRGLIVLFVFITAVVYADMFIENGIPSLQAFNIFGVYELRDNFHINQYVGYLYRWQVVVINPVMIINGLKNKKLLIIFTYTFLQVLAYLFTTQKTILFIIPLIFGTYLLGKWKYFTVFIYGAFSAGIAGSALLANINYDFYKVFSLFGRRVLLLPANLKFLYYEFFTEHKKIGLAGTLWGKFLEIESPYNMGIGNLISDYFFGLPDSNSNTGFLAEGYYMFGYMGIILAVVVFAFLLKCLDVCAVRNGFAFTVGISIYSIFMLNDTSLIDSVLFGNITILLIVLLFYTAQDRGKGKLC